MSKKTRPANRETMIPLQIKLREETRAKMKHIAAVNGLSLNDVGTMAMAAGLGIVEIKLKEIHQPELQAA